MLKCPRHLIYTLEIWASFDRCPNPESVVLRVTQAMPKFIRQQLHHSPSVELWYRFIVFSFLCAAPSHRQWQFALHLTCHNSSLHPPKEAAKLQLGSTSHPAHPSQCAGSALLTELQRSDRLWSKSKFGIASFPSSKGRMCSPLVTLTGFKTKWALSKLLYKWGSSFLYAITLRFHHGPGNSNSLPFFF